MQALQEDIPQILDYLETVLPEDGFLFGECSVADIAVASMLRNAAFVRLRPFEEVMLSTPIPKHRYAQSCT